MKKGVKKRNVLYFFLSVLVVILHNDYARIYEINQININPVIKQINDVLCYALTRVAIPNFLFFSGLFFWHDIFSFDDLKKKISSRIRTVVIPFFVWNIISMVWSFFISVFPLTRKHLDVREAFSFTWSNLYNGLFLSKYNMHNWYLAQLCIFLALSPIVYQIFKKKNIAFSSLLVVYVLYILKIKLFIYKQDFCGIYYFLGSYVGKYHYDTFISFSESERVKKKLFVFLNCFLCIFLQLIAFYLRLDGSSAGFLWLVSAFSFWLLINAVNIKDRRIYEYSFFVYLAHFIVAPCINKIIWLFLPHNDFFLLFTLLGGSALTVVFIVLTGIMIKKYMPLLWLLLTGEVAKTRNKMADC